MGQTVVPLRSMTKPFSTISRASICVTTLFLDLESSRGLDGVQGRIRIEGWIVKGNTNCPLKFLFLIRQIERKWMERFFLVSSFYIFIRFLRTYSCVQEVHDNFVCLWAQRDIRHWTHIEIVGSWANMYSDYGTRTDINPWMLNLVEH